MKRTKKLLALVLVMLFVVSSFAACGNKNDGGTNATKAPTATAKPNTTATPKATATPTPTPEPLKLSIMLPLGSNEHDGDEARQRVYRAIDEYCNTNITWTFYDENAYWESFPLVLASNDIPSVLVADKTAEFISAVENGAFYDITSYFGKGNYHNLDTIPEAVLFGAGINGKLYGVPRARSIARNGFGYRLDWVNNLGIKEPETIEEYYDMLVAFTNNDPDGNGINDTYGIGISNYEGTLNMLQMWWGAPNGWGIDAKGDLIPAHLTEEYKVALTEIRKWYAEGLINPDFDTFPSNEWDNLMQNNIAGGSGDVVDRFRREQGRMVAANPNVFFNLVPGMSLDGKTINVMPTSGFAKFVSINTQKVAEKDVPRVLDFLDKLNDAEMTNLINYGFEGEQYYVDENGYCVLYTTEEKTAKGVATYAVTDGLNQVVPYFHAKEEVEKIVSIESTADDQRKMEDEYRGLIPKFIEPFDQYEVNWVANYGAGFVSATYSEIGTTLDTIIRDARYAYIKGTIDMTGLEAEIDRWLLAGGQKVVDEMNVLFHAAGN